MKGSFRRRKHVRWSFPLFHSIMQSTMGKFSPCYIFNYVHGPYLFLILSTAHYSRVSWAPAVRNITESIPPVIWKCHAILLTIPTSIQTIQIVWLSVQGLWRELRMCWMIVMLILEVRQLGKLSGLSDNNRIQNLLVGASDSFKCFDEVVLPCFSRRRGASGRAYMSTGFFVMSHKQ